MEEEMLWACGACGRPFSSFSRSEVCQAESCGALHVDLDGL